jgi:hypothetical protein
MILLAFRMCSYLGHLVEPRRRMLHFSWSTNYIYSVGKKVLPRGYFFGARAPNQGQEVTNCNRY